MASLDRFKKAQDDPHSGFAAALTELRTVGKQGHWIWYVFPQLAGLGFSARAHAYGISSLDEAAEYLRDPVLGARLLTITSTVAERLKAGDDLEGLMGSGTDAMKIVSSLTLFGAVARRLYAAEGDEAHAALARAAEEVLSAARRQGHSPCEFTLARLPDRP